jgi:polysaccharide export outer membrane protein
VILRRNGAAEERIPVHLSDLIKDGDISQNVMMKPGDTLIIPQSFF